MSLLLLQEGYMIHSNCKNKKTKDGGTETLINKTQVSITTYLRFFIEILLKVHSIPDFMLAYNVGSQPGAYSRLHNDIASRSNMRPVLSSMSNPLLIR